MRRVDAVGVVGALLGLLSIGGDGGLFDPVSRVDVIVNPHVDFSRLDTYYWHGDQKIAAELEHHLQMVVAIQRRMSALGYAVDVHEPELLVEYQFEIGETEVSEPPEYVRDKEYDADDDDPWATLIFALITAALRGSNTIEHVELTVTLYESETNWLAYRAHGTFPWSEDEAEWILSRAVRELFEQMPPSGGA